MRSQFIASNAAARKMISKRGGVILTLSASAKVVRQAPEASELPAQQWRLL